MDRWQFGDRSFLIHKQLEKWLEPVNKVACSTIADQFPTTYQTIDNLGLTGDQIAKRMQRAKFRSSVIPKGMIILPRTKGQIAVYNSEVSDPKFEIIFNPLDEQSDLPEGRQQLYPIYLFSFRYKVTKWSHQKSNQKELNALIVVHYHFTYGYTDTGKRNRLVPQLSGGRRFYIAWDADSRNILRLSNQDLAERMEAAFELESRRKRYPFPAGAVGRNS
jgi:hypothetical protein